MHRTEHFALIWFDPHIFDRLFIVQWFESMRRDKAYRYAFPGNSGWENVDEFESTLLTTMCLLAFDHKNTLCGFALLWPIPGGFIVTYYIYPSYRPYVDELWKGVEDVVKNRWGDVVLMGFIWERHRAALWTAKRFGCEVCGKVKNLFGNGYDALIVAKEV